MRKLADISAFEALQSGQSGDSSMAVFNRECIGWNGASRRYPYFRFDIDEAVFDAIRKYAEPQLKFWKAEEPNPAILREASAQLGESIVKEFATEPSIEYKNVAHCVASGIWRTVQNIYPKIANKLGQPLYQAIYDWCWDVNKEYRGEFRQRQYQAQRQQQGQVQGQGQ